MTESGDVRHMPFNLLEKVRACIPRNNNIFGRLPSNMCAANCANCIIAPLTNCGFAVSILWPAETHLSYLTKGESNTNYWPCVLSTTISAIRIYDGHHFHTVSVSTQNALENKKEKLFTFRWHFRKQSRPQYCENELHAHGTPIHCMLCYKVGVMSKTCQFSDHFHITQFWGILV